jgi:hypothetical protein
MLLDIVTGAAWGYRAALSGLDAPNYAFADATGDSNPMPGATTELMAENSGMQKVALYPPDEFCTRFFVTPLVMGYCDNDDCTSCTVSTNMATEAKKWQKRTGVCLRTENGKIGIFNRNEAVVSKGQCVQVRCVGAIDLRSLVGSVIDAPDFRSEGGWAYLDLVDPSPKYDPDSDEDICDFIDHAAIVTKLQFGSPSFAVGSMINTADTIRTDRIETGVPGPGAPPSPCQ